MKTTELYRIIVSGEGCDGTEYEDLFLQMPEASELEEAILEAAAEQELLACDESADEYVRDDARALSTKYQLLAEIVRHGGELKAPSEAFGSEAVSVQVAGVDIGQIHTTRITAKERDAERDLQKLVA